MFLMKIYLIVLLNRIKMLANQTRFKMLRLFSCSCPPCLIDWKGQNNENLLYLFDVFMHLSNHISLTDPVQTVLFYKQQRYRLSGNIPIIPRRTRDKTGTGRDQTWTSRNKTGTSRNKFLLAHVFHLLVPVLCLPIPILPTYIPYILMSQFVLFCPCLSFFLTCLQCFDNLTA